MVCKKQFSDRYFMNKRFPNEICQNRPLWESGKTLSASNKPLEILPEKLFANNEKAAIFNIFLSKKNFWDTFFSEKTDKN